MPEPRGAGIGGGVNDASDQDAAGTGTGAGFTGHAGFGGHQGQISDRDRQVQLEQCLGTSEAAVLADSELDQPRQPMLNDHTASTVSGKGLTLL